MTTPKIAIIGKDSGLLSWATDLRDAFQLLGVPVFFCSLKPTDPSERDQVKKESGGGQLNSATICRRIAGELAAFAPQLVIVMNKSGLTQLANDYWREALPKDTLIVAWTCDRRDALPKGELPLLDRLYLFDSSSMTSMREAYWGTSCEIKGLPLAAVPMDLKDMAAARHPKDALVFVGTCTNYRLEQIARYRMIGGRLEAYGPRSGPWWTWWRNRRFDAAAQARLFASHLGAFNLLQPENTQHGLNLRVFEIPARGGLGTYPATPDLEKCFEPGKEIIAYHSLEALKEQMAALKAEPQRREAIRMAGRRRMLGEHTFAHRAAFLLEDCLDFYVLIPQLKIFD